MICYPTLVKTELIISALPDNQIDWNKVKEYAIAMKCNDVLTGNHGFPEITGWPFVVNEENIGETYLGGCDEITREVTEYDIGKVAFYVTEGHHRTLAAYRAEINFLEYTIDFNQQHIFNKQFEE